MSWGTLSGSDGAGLSGEKAARGSGLPPSACGSDLPPTVLSPDPDLPRQCWGGSRGLPASFASVRPRLLP